MNSGAFLEGHRRRLEHFLEGSQPLCGGTLGEEGLPVVRSCPCSRALDGLDVRLTLP